MVHWECWTQNSSHCSSNSSSIGICSGHFLAIRLHVSEVLEASWQRTLRSYSLISRHHWSLSIWYSWLTRHDGGQSWQLSFSTNVSDTAWFLSRFTHFHFLMFISGINRLVLANIILSFVRIKEYQIDPIDFITKYRMSFIFYSLQHVHGQNNVPRQMLGSVHTS